MLIIKLFWIAEECSQDKPATPLTSCEACVTKTAVAFCGNETFGATPKAFHLQSILLPVTDMFQKFVRAILKYNTSLSYDASYIIETSEVSYGILLHALGDRKMSSVSDKF